MYNRDELKAALQTGEHTVTFTKNNGELRVMSCTLEASVLPALSESANSRPENEDVLAVWDVDADGWRSFRIDSVSDFTV